MAYVPIQEKQLNELTQNGGGKITSTAGTNADATLPNPTELTQATASPGSAPNQFVNFQDLVDANSGATTDYSKSVGELIGFGDTSNTLQQNVIDAGNQVAAGYNDVGDEVIARVLADPSNKSFDGYSKLQSILGGGGYTGPNTASSIYTGAKQAVDTLSDKAGLLNDVEGLKTILLEKPNKGTTAGGAALDAALLTNTQGSKEQIKNIQDDVAALQGEYASNVQATQDSIAAKQAQATARRNSIVQQAQSTLGDIRAENDAELAALNAAENEKVDAFQNAAKTGDYARLQALLPGLDTRSIQSVLSQLSKSPDADLSQDLSRYASVTGPQYTTGNVLTDAEKTRYSGIQSIFGLGADDYAKLAGTGAQLGFDTDSHLAELNSRLTAQKNAYAAEQARIAAQQAYEQAIRDKQTADQAKAAAQQAGMQAWESAGGDATGGAAAVSSGIDAPNDTADQGTANGTVGSPTSASNAASIGSAIGSVTGVGSAVGAAIGMGINAAIGMAPASAPTGNTTAAAMSQMDAQAAENDGQAGGGTGTAADGNAGESADGTAGVGVGEGGIGSSGAGTAAGDAAGNSEGSGGAADGSGTAGDSGGGGGGGGKIICTAMNDLYGLPYRENKIWLMYAKRHLTPAHERGYHKVFLPLVDYGFKQGDGITHRAVRTALIWIGKNRTSDIKNELAGKPRNPLHRFLRAVIEPALAFIGRRVK